MKILKISAVFLLALGALLPFTVQADTPNWANMKISANYNKTTQELNVATILSGVTSNQTTPYTLNFRLDGNEYLTTFIYTDSLDTLSTSFSSVTKTFVTNKVYSFNFLIKEINGVVSYTNTGTLLFSGTSGTGVITLGTGTNIISTGTGTVIVPTGTGTLSSEELRAQKATQIIFDNIPKVATTLGKIDYLSNAIEVLKIYAVKYPSAKGVIYKIIVKLEVQKNIYLTGGVIPSKGFIPMYKSRAEEPLRINGIGNNPNYKSWRVD